MKDIKTKIPTRWLLLLCGTIFVVLSVFFYLKVRTTTSLNNSNFYYPKASFKIPKELMEEMIATKSASTVKLPIIMYHYIEYADPLDKGRVNLSVAPSVFEAQLKAINKSGYKTIFARDIPSLISQRAGMEISLTFDDGYEDFYYEAFPLLKKYQMKGTIYVIYNFIGRKGYLKEWQIKELLSSGFVELGAHTLNHAYLKGLINELAWKEIYDSKLLLEKMFNVPVPSFAYPYGAFSKDTVDMVRKAGYTNAVSVIPGIMQSDTNELYLFRIRPGYINTSNFAKSLEAFNK